MGSPLSNMHYLNRAASYGLQHPPSRYTAARQNFGFRVWGFRVHGFCSLSRVALELP